MSAARARHEYSQQRVAASYPRHEGPHADDVPSCPRCRRWPSDGATFRRPGFALGELCDQCIADRPSRGWRGLWASRELRANETGCITVELLPDISRGYLARIDLPLPGDKFDLAREFCKQSSAAKTPSGAALREYELDALADGIYEAESVGRLGAKSRVYFLVRDHRVALVYRGKLDALCALRRDWAS